MKHLMIISITILFISTDLHSQKQGNIWYFGEGAGLDFNIGEPIVLTDGNIYGAPQTLDEGQYNEGSAVISDGNGDLLFYTNGETIWNRNHDIMPNGSGLMGMYSSTHSAFIVPQPLSDSIFYVFTTDGLERNLEDGLRYSVVNMCLDNGMGDVIPNQKNLLLLDLVSEKLTAIRHQNGKDTWLIAHEFNSDAFYAYQISENGIINTMITNIGSIHTGNGFYSAIGQMKASPNGNKIALVFSNVNPAVAELFDFDKATGVLSNPISLETTNNEYGIEFSPNNSFLYVTNLQGLHQYDITAGGGSEVAINASKTTISSAGCLPSGMQLGPDDKIYISRCSNELGAINDPDKKGMLCNYDDKAIDFGTTAAKVSLPSFIAGYQYSNGTYNCTPTSIDDVPVQSRFRLYPNPARQFSKIEFNNDKRKSHAFVLYNMQGQIVSKTNGITTDEYEINTNNLITGVYYFKILLQGDIKYAGKLMVE